MGRGQGVALGVGAIAATLALLWWMAGDTGPPAEPPRAMTARPGDEPAPRHAEDDEPGVRALLGSPDDASTPLDAAGEAADPAELDDPWAGAQPTTIRGRVIDEAGWAVADASVFHFPTAELRASLDLGTSIVDPPFEWERVARAETDAQGRFELSTRELDRSEVTVESRSGNGLWQGVGMIGTYPQLVVVHPRFETTSKVCWTYTSGDVDVEDIVLKPGASVHGRAVDEQGRPVVGASVATPVTASSHDDMRYDEFETVSHALRTTTDATGAFDVSGLWPPQAELEIVADGFVPRVLEPSFAPGETVDLGELVLSRGGTISGHVVDTAGDPLAGVTLRARPADMQSFAKGKDSVAYEWRLRVFSTGYHEVETRTDEHGAFDLGTLDRDAYTLFVGMDGYEPERRIAIPVGTDDVLVSLQRLATIVLRLVDAESGEPVRDAHGAGKRLTDREAPRPYEFTRLDVFSGADALREGGLDGSELGVLLLRNVGRIRSTIVVGAPGYATKGVILPGVDAPETVSKTVRLRRESSLSGRISDASGAPIADATVELAAPEGMRVALEPRQETSGPDGRYRFGELTHGEWSLSASAAGHVESDPRPVAVPKQESVEVADIVLLPGGRIVGQVIDAHGAPSEGAVVLAKPVAEAEADPTPLVTSAGLVGSMALQRSWKAPSTADGRFALDGLPPGDYPVTTHPGAEALASVVAGGEAEVLLVQRRLPRVHGRVSGPAGPVEGAVVEAGVEWRPGSFMTEVETTTSNVGDYEFELYAPGEYRLQALDDGARTPLRDIALDWGQVELVDLHFGGARLVGLVLDAATGEPIADAAVRTFHQSLAKERGEHWGDFAFQSETQTGIDGRFVRDRLVAGEYSVQVSRPGYVSGGATVELTEGAVSDELRFELIRGAEIRGTVRSLSGAGLAHSVMVLVQGVTDESFHWVVNLDDERSFRCVAMPPGTYRLEVRDFEHGGDGAMPDLVILAEQQVVLALGETVEIELLVD